MTDFLVLSERPNLEFNNGKSFSVFRSRITAAVSNQGSSVFTPSKDLNRNAQNFSSNMRIARGRGRGAISDFGKKSEEISSFGRAQDRNKADVESIKDQSKGVASRGQVVKEASGFASGANRVGAAGEFGDSGTDNARNNFKPENNTPFCTFRGRSIRGSSTFGNAQEFSKDQSQGLAPTGFSSVRGQRGGDFGATSKEGSSFGGRSGRSRGGFGSISMGLDDDRPRGFGSRRGSEFSTGANRGDSNKEKGSSRCRNCGQQDHWAKECPRPRKIRAHMV